MTDATIVVTRTYRATLDEVWELWTTKDGIEAWWGPEGFRVEVTSLELKAGGHLGYAMIAAAPEMVEFMKKSGMKTRTLHRNDFTVVKPKTRLEWTSLIDFVPGVSSYPTATVVELAEAKGEVTVTLRLSKMHDETWTERQRMGWEMELGKLDRLLQARHRA